MIPPGDQIPDDKESEQYLARIHINEGLWEEQLHPLITNELINDFIAFSGGSVSCKRRTRDILHEFARYLKEN